MKYKFYTGVGSRNTPTEILKLITRISQKLASTGYILRSGGADGADHAFEMGAGLKKRIYRASSATRSSMALASKYHPAWHRCSPYARQLHGRNAFQVLGPDLNNPSDFLICWTKDGCKSHAARSIATGGTGTAISIADAHRVPVFNLANPDDYRRLAAFVILN